jgi:hypothetical protein
MAFLRQCLHELRSARPDWAPEEMDWFLQTGVGRYQSHAGLPAEGVRDLRLRPARSQAQSVAGPRTTHGSLVRGFV